MFEKLIEEMYTDDTGPVAKGAIAVARTANQKINA